MSTKYYVFGNEGQLEYAGGDKVLAKMVYRRLLKEGQNADILTGKTEKEEVEEELVSI